MSFFPVQIHNTRLLVLYDIQSVPNIATYGYTIPSDCNDFGFDLDGVPIRGQNSDKSATEHILEFQFLTIFLDEQISEPGNIYTALKDGISKVNLCQHLEDYRDPPPVRWITINGIARSPLQWVSYQFPGSDSDYNAEFVLLDSGVNTAKEGVSHAPHAFLGLKLTGHRCGANPPSTLTKQ